MNLVDGMILVAATALAFAVARPALLGRPAPLVIVLAVVPSLLIAWTLAVLALRLRQPRPSLRALMRQPGFTAIAAASAALAVAAVPFAAVLVYRWFHPVPTIRVFTIDRWVAIRRSTVEWLPIVLVHSAAFVGPAVAGGWLHLAASGRRRTERGWIDPLGRFLGAIWVAAAGVELVLAVIRNYPR